MQVSNGTAERPACGHVFCKDCIVSYMDYQRRCPAVACVANIQPSHLVPADAVERVIKKLPYKCPECREAAPVPSAHYGKFDACPRGCNGRTGCGKRPSSASTSAHDDVCLRRLYVCGTCKTRVARVELNQHFAGCWNGVMLLHHYTTTVPKGSLEEVDRIETGQLAWMVGKSVRDDILSVDLSLAGSSMQPHYRMNLAAMVRDVSVAVHHPITGAVIARATSPYWRDMDCDMFSSTSFTVCDLKALRDAGAYDPVKGLVELHLDVSWTVERLWDPKQRSAKRQRHGPAGLTSHPSLPTTTVAVTAVAAPEVALGTAPEATSEPALPIALNTPYQPFEIIVAE